jgi:hypothetical protein
MKKQQKLPIASCSNYVRDTELGLMFGIIGYASTLEQARRVVTQKLTREDKQLISCGFELFVWKSEADSIGNCCGKAYFAFRLGKKIDNK